MGNDGQGQLILLKSDLIRFEFKKDGYFDCQLVEGSLILQANKEIKLDEIIIRLRMIQSFNIILSKDNVVTNYFQKKIFLQKLNLPYIFNSNNSQNYILKPGTRNISFRFFLPKNIAPSFEYPRENKKGQIRYIFTAEVISGNDKYTTEEYFLVKQRPFIYPITTRLKIEDKRIIKTIGQLTKGESLISVFTPSKNMLINGPIKYELEIDNRNCEDNVNCVFFKLIRIVTFKKNNELYNFDTIIASKKYNVKCAKGCMKALECEDMIIKDKDLKELYFPDKNNPYLGKITDLNLLMPSLETPILKCEYKLEISVNFDSDVLEKDRPTVIVPIYASHMPQKESEGDLIIIQGQFKNIKKDLGPYAPIYSFKDEDNNNFGINNINNVNANFGNNNITNNNIINNNYNNIRNNPYNNNVINNYDNNIKSIDGNKNCVPGMVSSQIAKEVPISITSNDFPTLASINREIYKKGDNNMQGNNPYNNIHL